MKWRSKPIHGSKTLVSIFFLSFTGYFSAGFANSNLGVSYFQKGEFSYGIIYLLPSLFSLLNLPTSLLKSLHYHRFGWVCAFCDQAICDHTEYRVLCDHTEMNCPFCDSYSSARRGAVPGPPKCWGSRLIVRRNRKTMSNIQN